MTLLQTNSDLAQYWPAVLAALMGALYGGWKIYNGYDPDVGMNWAQYAKTILIWGVAGAVAQRTGKGHNYEAIAVTVTTVAPFINSVWDTFLPPAAGGSRTHGRGTHPNTGIR